MAHDNLNKRKVFATRIGAIAVSAGLMALAAPPIGLWPLALVGLVPLYLVIAHLTPWRALAYGWLAGSLLVFAGCFWWAPTLIRFAHLPAWQALGLTLIFCVYQGLTYGVWAGLTRWFTTGGRLSWFIAGPLCLVIAESLLPFIFKMYLAITVWSAWPLTQVAELGGAPAVSALVLLINLVLAELWLARKSHSTRGLLVAIKMSMPFQRNNSKGSANPPIEVLARAILVLVVLLLIGTIRAGHVAYKRSQVDIIKVGLLQPNFGILPASERELHGKNYLTTLRKATVELGNEGVDLIVWPESAWPYLFDREINREFPKGHPWELRGSYSGRLLFGTLSHSFGGTEVFNSAVLVDGSGAIVGRHDKHRLVPFAERVPFEKRFPQWAARTREKLPDWPEIQPGPRPDTLHDGDLDFGVMICSEDLESGFAHRLVRKGADLLVSIASDAWFGDSGAPRQHLALAAFRAIETRRDLIRCTNTGASAIVDAMGRLTLVGPVLAVDANHKPAPTLLVGTAAPLTLTALAPFTSRFFPYVCLLTLIVATMRQGRKSPQPNAKGS